MPAEYPLFPSRDQMRDYILGFAAQHGLGSHIRFNTAVTAARPLDATGLAGWEITTSDGERRSYDGVIVANGHLWDPFVPEYPGRFAGHVLHSGRLPQRRRPRTASGCSSSGPATRAAISRSTPRRPAARPASRCATGSCSSPRRCSAGRARSCRCSAPAGPRPGARDARADRRRPRPVGALRAAGAGHAQPAPQPPGGQRPAPALHPPRPRPRRARASSASTATTSTSPTARSARSTPSSTRPASRRRSRSWTRRCCSAPTASRCAWRG